jgi:hypothetical protein
LPKLTQAQLLKTFPPAPRLASYAIPAACFADKANCKLFLVARKQVNIQVWLFPQKQNNFKIDFIVQVVNFKGFNLLWIFSRKIKRSNWVGTFKISLLTVDSNSTSGCVFV